MRLLLLPVVLVCASRMSSFSAAAEEKPLAVAVMTFNIRYDNPRDGVNRWSVRRKLAADVVRKSKADFVGLQEAMPHQISQLAEDLTEYGQLGRSRDVNPKRGEACPIFFRHKRWKVIEHKTEWLSDTPDKPGSRSWGNTLPRIFTWAKFEEISTGRKIVVFNTHFDHQSQKSREQSAALLAKRIAAVDVKTPVVLTGDFNAGPTNAAIKTFRKSGLVDTFAVKSPKASETGTFHGWSGRKTSAKIDAVMVRSKDKARITAAAIIHNHQGNVYPSDHFPVTAAIEFP